MEFIEPNDIPCFSLSSMGLPDSNSTQGLAEDPKIQEYFTKQGGMFECRSCGQKFIKSQCSNHCLKHEAFDNWDLDQKHFVRSEDPSIFVICNFCKKKVKFHRAKKHFEAQHCKKRKNAIITDKKNCSKNKEMGIVKGVKENGQVGGNNNQSPLKKSRQLQHHQLSKKISDKHQSAGSIDERKSIESFEFLETAGRFVQHKDEEIHRLRLELLKKSKEFESLRDEYERHLNLNHQKREDEESIHSKILLDAQGQGFTKEKDIAKDVYSQENQTQKREEETAVSLINIDTLRKTTREIRESPKQTTLTQDKDKPAAKTNIIALHFTQTAGQFECNRCTQKYVKHQCLHHLAEHDKFDELDPDQKIFTRPGDPSPFVRCNTCGQDLKIQKAISHFQTNHENKRERSFNEEEEDMEPTKVRRGDQFLQRKSNTLVDQQSRDQDIRTFQDWSRDDIIVAMQSVRKRQENEIKKQRSIIHQLEKEKEEIKEKVNVIQKKLEEAESSKQELRAQFEALEKTNGEYIEVNKLLQQNLNDKSEQFEQIANEKKMLQQELDGIRDYVLRSMGVNIAHVAR